MTPARRTSALIQVRRRCARGEKRMRSTSEPRADALAEFEAILRVKIPEEFALARRETCELYVSLDKRAGRVDRRCEGEKKHSEGKEEERVSSGLGPLTGGRAAHGPRNPEEKRLP